VKLVVTVHVRFPDGRREALKDEVDGAWSL
jgi:hypothetical protein